MFEKLTLILFLSFLISQAQTCPLHDVGETRLLLELVPVLEAYEARQMQAFEASQMEPRLPLPGPQELEAIKRIAQLLDTLDEQVISAIIDDDPDHWPAFAFTPPYITEVPSDPVQLN